MVMVLSGHRGMVTCGEGGGSVEGDRGCGEGTSYAYSCPGWKWVVVNL